MLLLTERKFFVNTWWLLGLNNNLKYKNGDNSTIISSVNVEKKLQKLLVTNLSDST